MRNAAATTPLRMVTVCLTMLMIIASGCSRLAGAPQAHNLTWSRIALPAGVEASSLAVTAAGLLVGGAHHRVEIIRCSSLWMPRALYDRCRCIRTARTRRSRTLCR